MVCERFAKVGISAEREHSCTNASDIKFHARRAYGVLHRGHTANVADGQPT